MHVSCFGVLSLTGIIYEVACQQCGGSENLENAVKRGDVKRKESFFYFPKNTVGAERKHTVEEEMHQQQERTQAEWQEYDVGIRSMVVDVIQGHPLNGTVWGQPFGATSGSSSNAPLAIASGGKEAVIEATKEKRERLVKAIALSDKCKKMVEGLDSPPFRVAAELQSIMTLTEAAELLQTEMGFIVKFGKDFKNAEITESSGKAICTKAEDVTTKIVLSVKAIRVWVGPGGTRDLVA